LPTFGNKIETCSGGMTRSDFGSAASLVCFRRHAEMGSRWVALSPILGSSEVRYGEDALASTRDARSTRQFNFFQLARSTGLGAGVGRALGVGSGLGVGVGLGVAVAVAVGVGVGVDDAVGVAVAVAVAVGVAVAVAVGVGDAVGVGVGVPPPVGDTRT